MRNRIIVILFFAICRMTNAQNEFSIIEHSPVKFQHITSVDGLMHNSIVAILQDSKGFMWFGTNNGLYKYNGYDFQYYSHSPDDAHTLLNRGIKVLYEDKKGTVWVGTEEGLCRYNEENDSFDRNLNRDKNISESITHGVNCIYEDRDGLIWVGTKVGLYQLKLIESGAYSVKETNSKSVENVFYNNVISTITGDKNGNIWVGTSSGLFVMSKNSVGKVSIKRIDNPKNKKVALSAIVDLILDKEDNLWVATRMDLNKLRLDKKTGDYTFTPYLTKKTTLTKEFVLDNRLSKLLEDANGYIWIGTKGGGLIKLNPKTEKFKTFKQVRSNKNSLRSNDISDLYIDDSGVLWVGTQRGGLSKINLESKKVAHYNYSEFNENSISGNLINTIYEDSKKNVWISTYDKGLNRIVNTDTGIKFIHYTSKKNAKNRISGDNVFALVEDNFGSYWAGTQSNGLNQFVISKDLNTSNISVKVYAEKNKNSNFPTNKISTLYKDKKGDIWVGTFGNHGLIRFTPKGFGQEVTEFDQYIHDAKKPNTIGGVSISVIYEDSDGILWVGSKGGGLYKVIRDEFNRPLKFIGISNQPYNRNSLSNNSVFSVHEDCMGDIWIGTFGGGLNRIPKEEKHKSKPKLFRYNTKDGLPSDEIYGILEDENCNLWISTNNGISKYSIKKNSFTNLHLSSGLQDVNFRKNAYFKGGNGLMYFGGINGFNVFYPDGFTDNKYLPKVEIVDFKVFNKSAQNGEEILGEVLLEKAISATKEIVLKNAHNSFSFEFAALHYVSPNQNNYAYKLEGFDKDWIVTDSKRRFAGYSNLTAGKYIFKVKASNNDGVWTEDYQSIEIKVLPPFYKTWWAFLCYVGLVILLMWLFRRYILINEEYQSKLMIEKVEQEKIKEINRIKLEFFTNVSHEFKTPLTLILGPLQSLISSKETTKKVKESLLLMERNANQLFRLINQIMEFRKVETKELKLQRSKGDLVSFCKEELFSFKVLADKKDIDLAFECCENRIGGYFDWDKMEKILNNLISNSIKYSNNGGRVKLSLSVPTEKKGNAIEEEDQDKLVRIVLEDSGDGIPQGQFNLIFDRFYQVKENTGESNNGSGIGLAFTKSLIDLHKGTIYVDSQESVGSKFTVELPLLVDLKAIGQPSNRLENHLNEDVTTSKIFDLDADITEVSVEDSNLKSLEGTSEIQETDHEKDDIKKRLLIVEDNPDMLVFITRTLEDMYDVHTAVDGVEGLKAALKIVPDLIISDVMMPNMDGIEFCGKIKENEITSHVPVILLTAKGSMEHRIEGLQVGADSYIPKPFDIRHLEVRVEKLLFQRESLKKKFTNGEIKLDSQKIGINEAEKNFLEKMEAIIQENLTNPDFGVEDLGDGLGYSRMQLYRKLKTIRGLSANEFIREYRIKKAAVYLRETDMKIYEILYDVGISNHSYFTKCFKQYFNMSPRKYIEQYRGKTVK
jgi:signal transduction histidine kinase/ligand-binding sensor domain-containing protein/CheY-like chemotaxis protein/AraC-like DNA-binding protein